MLHVSGCKLQVKTPTCTVDNGKIKGIEYCVDFIVLQYRTRIISPGRPVDSPPFHLGNNNEFEASVHLFFKGGCFKNCLVHHGSNYLCAYVKYTPKLDEKSKLDGNLLISMGIDGYRCGKTMHHFKCESKDCPDTWIWGLCSIGLPSNWSVSVGDIRTTFKIALNVQVTHLGSGKSLSPKIEENSLNQDMGVLVRSGQYADITLVVDGARCKAHKAILASRSSVFEKMFETNMSEKESNEVEISDMDFGTLQSLVRYMYTDEVTNMEELGEALLSAAEKYLLEGLKRKCEEALSRTVNVNNAARLFLLAELHRADNLKKQVVRFINRNKQTVFKTEEWQVLKEKHPSSVVQAFF